MQRQPTVYLLGTSTPASLGSSYLKSAFLSFTQVLEIFAVGSSKCGLIAFRQDVAVFATGFICKLVFLRSALGLITVHVHHRSRFLP